MELDQMKDVWKQQFSSSEKKLKEEDVISMISHPSRGPVASMKRNLRRELYFVIFSFSIAALVFFLAFESKMIGYSAAYIFLMAVFALYYYNKTRLLGRMQCVNCEVKTNVSLQVSTLEKYIRYNLIVSTLVYPAFLLFGAWILYTNFYSLTPKPIFVYSVSYATWITTLVWVLFSVITSIPMYYLNKKYIHWLYGKHISRLKWILKEMDNEGNGQGASFLHS